MNQYLVPSQDTRVPQIVYALYLAGLLTGSVTTLIGVIVAYVYRGDAAPWLQAHYRYLIRTFWIGLLYSFVAFVLSLIAVGVLLWPLLMIWLIVRCAIGIREVRRQQAPPRPGSWLW
ncbi:DUF4870 family protein [Litchfieldella xinjiangensis]|uniref:DUF4870 family protein n=1 Tax=Litchfieldella xinjiangensis TaxID=1166948 RepID=UPI0005BA196A|nr:DUF4870 domain-containing protein [Halomonas xinjiangensis]